MKYTIIAFILFCLLSSCDNSTYTDAIPANCSMIATMPQDEISPNALDGEKDIYTFMTIDGIYGICAALKDEYALETYLHGNEDKDENGKNTKQEEESSIDSFDEYEDIPFCMKDGKWLIAHTDNTMLMMGPVIADGKKTLMRRMVKLLGQPEEKSIKHTALWKHFTNITSKNDRMAMAVSSLPELLGAPFMLGTPRGTSPDEVILEATLQKDDSTLCVTGHTCSDNINIDQHIRKALNSFRTIKYGWHDIASHHSTAIFINANGKELIPLVNSNKALNTLLLGTDVYERIKETDKCMAITIDNITEEKQNIQFSTWDDKKTSNNGEKIILAVDMSKIFNSKELFVLPLLSGVNRVVYVLTDKAL